MWRQGLWICGCWLSLAVCGVWADGPADNLGDKVRPVPPPGVAVSDAQKEEITAGLKVLDGLIAQLREPQKDLAVARLRNDLLPDVLIFHKAVHDALAYGEFFNPGEIPVAMEMLKVGQDRAQNLLQGKAPWTTQTGLIPRGYISKIDGSVQPYGLVIPANYNFQDTTPVRLDIWCHGRGETLSELSFVNQRLKQIGQVSPKNAIVLHPYGRYCNANKFAGEIDVLEGLEAVRKHYRIDDDRVVMRGFSMGGAACWQLAVHYPDLWVAATPGAGFSETPDFLKVFQKEDVHPTPYERKLWHWYDCPDWCRNLAQLPTIAYSGENDIQKQAADIMERQMAQDGLRLLHLIGPKTAHSYHPETLAEIERRLESIVARGRQRVPTTLDFTTYTLRYARNHWILVEGLEEHWSQAHIQAQLRPENILAFADVGITDLTFTIPSAGSPFDPYQEVHVQFTDIKNSVGEKRVLDAGRPFSDGSWQASFHRTSEGWQLGKRPVEEGVLRKRPGLQGPIDDAFLDSFLFVLPTGKSKHEHIQKWVELESEHAITHWRSQFRGQARVKKDTEVTPEDIAQHNLVLWGDADSNQFIKQVASKLPIGWGEKEILVGKQAFAADKHVLLMIAPNPLNSNRYVVLNSSFTYREYDYLNNARQVPKLPDWAVIDATTPRTSKGPGKVVEADFFDERWQLKGPQ